MDWFWGLVGNLLEVGGKILRAGAIAGAVAGAASLIYIAVRGCINRRAVQEAMQDSQVQAVIVEAADHCTNRVRIRDLDSGNKFELCGEGISPDIHVNDIITG